MPQSLGLCFLRLEEIPKAIFCFSRDQTEPCLESRSPLAGSPEYREGPQYTMELLHWAPQIPLVQPRDLWNSAKFTSILNTAVTIFPNLIFLPIHLECAGSALSKTLAVTWHSSCTGQRTRAPFPPHLCSLQPIKPWGSSRALPSRRQMFPCVACPHSRQPRNWKLARGLEPVSRNYSCPGLPWASSTQEALTFVLNISTCRWVPENGTTGHSAVEFNWKSLIWVHQFFILLMFQKKEVFCTLT